MIPLLVSKSPVLRATPLGFYRYPGVARVNIFSAGEPYTPLSSTDLKLKDVVRSFDGKVKVWSIDTRSCVATHSETEKAIWSVKWLPKVGKSEGFATAGSSRSISFYREATGG
jgi:WD40 repeat protein